MQEERLVLLHDLDFSKHLQQAGYQPVLMTPEEAFKFFQNKEAELLLDWRASGTQGHLFALGLVPNTHALMRDLIKLFMKGPLFFPAPLAAIQAVTREVEERNSKEKSLGEAKELNEAAGFMLAEISKAVLDRSPYFALHGKKIEQIALSLGQMAGLPQENLKNLRQAALLHNLGLIGIPEEILHKPGPLLPNEKSLIQNHPSIARKILSAFPSLNPVGSILTAHHEWYNGEGYPTGLKGNEIPLEAQILAIAEAYASLISLRPYRQAGTSQDAVNTLLAARETQFNPDLLNLLPLALSKLDLSKNDYRKPQSHIGIVALGALLHVAEDYGKALDIWEKAKGILEPKSSLKILADIWASQTLWTLGHLQGAEKAKRAVVDAYETNDSLLLGHALLNLATLELSRGRLDECADLLPLALDLLEQEKDYYAGALAVWSLSKLEFSIGRQKKNFRDSFPPVIEKFLFYVERLGLENFVLQRDSESLALLVECFHLDIRKDTVRHLLKQIGIKTQGRLLPVISQSKEEYSPEVLLLLSEGESSNIMAQKTGTAKETSPHPKDYGLFIRCFGEFQAFCSGTKIQEGDWKTRKVRSVFAYLISHFEHPVVEEKLLDLFWPEADVEKARHTLHTTIYRLRRTLEPTLDKGTQSKYIHHKGDTYRFNRSGADWLDLEEFERVVKAGQIFENQGDLPQAKREYEKGISLYEGPFIPEYEESWCIPIREKYQRLFIRSLSSLIQFVAAKEEWGEVIALSQRILKEDPLNEWAHQTLMQAFHASGRRDEAIRQYHACLELLKKNLNIEPSEETVKLYHTIKQS